MDNFNNKMIAYCVLVIISILVMFLTYAFSYTPIYVSAIPSFTTGWIYAGFLKNIKSIFNYE